MGKEEKNTYTIKTEENLGEVKIADEVVAVIAGLAAMEVDGVASMAGSSPKDIASRLGVKSMTKGVRVDVLEGIVTAATEYGTLIHASVETAKVQEKVKAAIENMTGLDVADVNIRITGVEMPEEN